MPVEQERGFIIVASDNADTDYISCATALATSIKRTMPHASVALLTDTAFDSDLFDYVIEFPYGDVSTDNWKLANDWQAFYASPYRQTIKLEADMILPQSIDHWWDIMQKKDVCLTVNARDYLQNKTECKHYRKVFVANNLLNVYNAITYWRVSKTATVFFKHVEHIFRNWQLYKSCLKECHDAQPTTDVVYAIAASLMGETKLYIPNSSIPSMIHMKQHINRLSSHDWRDELNWELNNNSIRIGTVEQLYPVHYHIKEFAKTLNDYYDRN